MVSPGEMYYRLQVDLRLVSKPLLDPSRAGNTFYSSCGDS